MAGLTRTTWTVVVSAAMMWSGLASAHAGLVSAEPAPNATADAPMNIHLQFNEEIVAKLSSFRLTDADGNPVPMRFSALGPTLIGLLVVTGCVNTWLLIGPGHWRGWVQQPYGWVLMAKLALFGGMLALAFQHRYRATPKLHRALASGGRSEVVVGALRRTLLAETVLAILILAAVAVLGNLEPPASLP